MSEVGGAWALATLKRQEWPGDETTWALHDEKLESTYIGVIILMMTRIQALRSAHAGLS